MSKWAAHRGPAVELDTALESARRQVRGPAIGLLVAGMLSVITTPIFVVRVESGDAHLWVEGTEYVFAIVLFYAELLSSLVPGVLMILAATNMKRLRAYRLAVAAGILAIVLSPINLFIGLPIGIWVLVVLSQRDIRAAFKLLRPARSRPVLRAVIAAIIILLMAVCLAGVTIREAWEESLFPKEIRLAAIEQAYRPQLDKLAGFAYDYDVMRLTRRKTRKRRGCLPTRPSLKRRSVTARSTQLGVQDST